MGGDRRDYWPGRRPEHWLEKEAQVGNAFAVCRGLLTDQRPTSSSNSSNSSSSFQPLDNTAPSSNNTQAPFPAGSYLITTVLDTVQTDCVSQPSDWTCKPGYTYSQSPAQAEANLTWVIAAEGDGFVISALGDIFSITFPNTSLILTDTGTDEERYTFNVTAEKGTTRLDKVQCFYNNATIEGSLYTKKPKTYPSSAASTNNTSGILQPWPQAVDLKQTTDGGSDVPECFNMDNGQKTDRVMDGITPKASTDVCNCEYKNFDL